MWPNQVRSHPYSMPMFTDNEISEEGKRVAGYQKCYTRYNTRKIKLWIFFNLPDVRSKHYFHITHMKIEKCSKTQSNNLNTSNSLKEVGIWSFWDYFAIVELKLDTSGVYLVKK